jgi:hypothetical protein
LILSRGLLARSSGTLIVRRHDTQWMVNAPPAPRPA